MNAKRTGHEHTHRGLLTTVLAAFLAACGGGGHSDTGSLSYTGLTTPAAITQGNATELTYHAYQSGSTGSSLARTVGAQQTTAPLARLPRPLVMARALRAALLRASMDGKRDRTAAGLSQTQTLIGSCGGTGSYTFNVNDSSGAFTGTFTFSNYCDMGSTLSGSMTFSGEFDVNTFTFGPVSMSFDLLTAAVGGESFTNSGNISFDMSTLPVVMTMNMLMRDDVTEKVYRIDDATLTFTDNVTAVSLGISGRFYDPDYGYVEITTPSALYVTADGDWPSAGAIRATDSTGVTATLTALSNVTYQIDLDENGDGASDYSNTGNWSDL